MKKFVNDPQRFVPEMLEGLALANPDTLRYVPEYNLIMRADIPRADKVSIVQGSGSGHEPAHVMVVGRGMLDAACPGDIFAAPPMDYVYETAKLVASPRGVLLLVNNYTGDRMSFDMAREMVESEGIRVATLMIDDDVAVKDSLYTAGRRGVGGTVLAEKIVGAAAEAGADLEAVTTLCQRVQDNVRSMGMALTSCTVPAAGKPTFDIGDDEMEIGIGIHGEPGRRREKLAPADEIVEMLAGPILDERIYGDGDQVLAFVNGMGGTPLIELYIVYRKLAEILSGRGIRIARNLVGSYITSLEMAGTSITLLKLDDELIRLWDAPVHTAALRWGV
jgi:phosphoenolpyruvate---glycerone phosphotransferase subunit DhaK